ncbi:MAG TPA: alpha/beta fold hydrolase [Jatrophihabitans sp.]
MQHVPVGGAQLYVRDIGTGPPIFVLHGGPDFDHTYLLPELDELADRCRLIYYDQRGRGRSAEGVQPEDVSIASEIADLDRLIDYVGLAAVALLGHSWGGVLAMEYAIAHPARVSHLILLGTAPASAVEAERLFEARRAGRTESERERMTQLAATPAFQAGDPDAETEYYREHFRSALRPEDLDRLVARLRVHFTASGVCLARAIEEQLYAQTWGNTAGYDLVPALAALPIPTSVLHGEHDIVPLDMAARIADAMPAARLTVLRGCGHFAYLERPDLVQDVVSDLVTAAN